MKPGKMPEKHFQKGNQMFTTETTIADIRSLVKKRNIAERQKIAAAKASDYRGYKQHMKEQRSIEAAINERRNQIVSRSGSGNQR